MFETHRSMVVSAGAGSGKTRVLVGRYMHLIESRMADVDEIVAITFTDKAAAEMKARVWAEMAAREAAARASGDEEQARRWHYLARRLSTHARISTIDSFCARLVRENPLEAGVDPEFAVLDPAEGPALLRDASLECLSKMVEEGDADISQLVADFGVGAVAEAIEKVYDKVRSTGRTPAYFADLTEKAVQTCDDEHGDEHVRRAKAVARACERLEKVYWRLKGNGAVLDFTDMELAAYRLLSSTAAGLRVRQSIKFVLVDEYQDTNELQDRLVSLLAGTPPSNRLFVVGDVKQSIYGFRGAQVKVFQRAMEEAERDVAIWSLTTLDCNFRSVRPLVDLANAVFRPPLKGLWTSDASSARPAAPSARYHAELHLVSHARGETDAAAEAEAEMVASRIAAMVLRGEQLVCEVDLSGSVRTRAPRYRDIAVLLRKTTDVKLFEKALSRHGVPYYVVAGRGFFARPEVKMLVCMIRAVCDPHDDLSLAAVLRHPVFGLSDESLLRLALEGGGVASGFEKADAEAWRRQIGEDEADKLAWAQSCLGMLRAMAGRLGTVQLLRKIIEITGFDAYVAGDNMGEQAVANIDKLLRLAHKHALAGLGPLEFAQEMEDFAEDNAKEPEAALAEEEADVVTVMTVHKSKGLEFPVVFVPQLCREGPKQRPKILLSETYGIACPVSSDMKLQETDYGKLVLDDIKQTEKEEALRTLYVAATRASDYLVLTSNMKGDPCPGSLKKNAQEWLVPFAETLACCLQEREDALCASAPRTDGPEREALRPQGTAPWAGVAVVGADPEAPRVLVTMTPLAEAEHGVEAMWRCAAGGSPVGEEVALARDSAPDGKPPLVAPIHQVAPIPSISVSALMCLSRCPRWYVYEYVLGLSRVSGFEGEGEGLETMSASLRGQIVHEVCRRARTEQEAREALRHELDSLGVSGDSRAAMEEKLLPLVRAFLKSPEARAEGYREQPFLLALGHTVVAGIMDYVAYHDHGAVVVDLKTNAITEGEAEMVAEDYRVQMKAYALAAHRGFGVDHVTAELHFLAPDVRVPMEFGPEEFEKAEQELARLVELAATCTLQSTSPKRSRHCDTCYYAPLCWGQEGERSRAGLDEDEPEDPYEAAVLYMTEQGL